MITTKPLRAALYARYSTDSQREASIEDQFRVCERMAEREHFDVVARFEDRGISGGTSARPGYQCMLEAARRHAFSAILAEDLKRLWREQAEQWRCIKELLDLGVHIITASGIDSRQPNFEVIASVIGAAAELDRKESAYRTRRGLEGRAVAGKSAGGRAYGYIPANHSETGRLEINEAQASTVRRVFQLYADGVSPRDIASRLNADGIPSPGASWKRTNNGLNCKRRNGKWVASAIHGEVRKGTGILNNELYRGVMIWGRMRWERGAADSSKRVAKLIDDRSQWVVHREERLRIVPEELWERVKARQGAIASSTKKLQSACHGRRGRPAAHLLTGLMVCESCGSNFISVDRQSYGCASHKNGGFGACTNNLRVRREIAETLILREIRVELLSDEAVARAQKAMHSELKRLQSTNHRAEHTPAIVSRKVAKFDAEVDQLRGLMKAGKLSAAPAQAAIAELERQRAELIDHGKRDDSRAGVNVIRMLPQAAELYRAAVRDLYSALKEPAERLEARALILELLDGKVPVRPDEAEGCLIARLSLNAGVLLKAANASRFNDFQNGSGAPC